MRRPIFGRLRRLGKRFIQRGGFWILLVGAVTGMAVYRSGNSVPVMHPAAISLQSLPPAGRKLVLMHYDGVRFADLLDDLGRQTGLRLQGDWKTLAQSGIFPETIVNLKGDGKGDNKYVSIQIALGTCLNRNNHFVDADIAADFTCDPVIVSTWEALHCSLVTEIYPIGDLLQVHTPWVYSGRVGLRSYALCGLIEETVEPGSWSKDGCTCDVNHDNLVVKATPTMQYQVKQVLERLQGR